ncbi:MAG: efflux RND transporter periplasmic adaptor subunit [Lachnospiraceae bacterium]|nr:efflux RND transporter periplasmic adaptor subunit [Lachnospiraceae bacterium]
MKRRVRGCRLLAGAVLGLSMMLPGCGKEKAELSAALTEQEVAVTVEQPQQMTLTTQSRYIGTVQADGTVYVMPMVSAEVLTKNFEVGDHVQEGDLLFTMDDSLAQIGLSQANAGLASAQAGLNAAKAGYEAQEAALQAQEAALAAQEVSADVTRVSAAETMGKMGTTEQQLLMAVESAEAQVKQARLAAGSATDAYYLAEDQVDKAWDTYDNYDDAPASLLMQYPKKDDYKLQIEALEVQKSNAYRQMLNATEACNTAEQAYKVAQQQLRDYQEFTKGTIAASANAQVVGADQQLAAATAQLEAGGSQLEATGAQVDAGRAGVSQAAAAVENAEKALSYYTVSSPVSGTITAVNVTEHNFATPSQAAYVIQADEQAKVVFYVAERTMREMEVGNAAVFEHDGQRFDGKIVSISDVIDTAQGLYKVEAQANEKNVLPSNGSSISVSTASRVAKGALSVPSDCIYYDGELAFLYVAEDGVAKKREVVTGLTENARVEIKEGLLAEEQVIVNWSSNLKDGSRITIQ